jgi:glycerol-3-phosphate dehydrogenase
MTAETFDIAIVGAGVIGCAVARELSRYELATILLEANSDLGAESSKGNSALMCSGYDTPHGSLERRLVRRGYARYLAEAPALGLPLLRIGGLTIAWTDDEARILQQEYESARADGFDSVRLLDRDGAYERCPNLGSGIICGLWAPDEAIVDPFSTPFAYAADAVANGVRYRPSSPVTAAQRHAGVWRLTVPEGVVAARFVINCGGIRADAVEALGGFNDLRVRPRRGQYMLFDKTARPLLDVIVTPAPKPHSRGILVTPTVFGNILVGPTAEDVDDRDDRRVTAAGLEQLEAAARRVLPGLRDHAVVTCFAGMRPATDRPEYRIIPRLESGWLAVAGIRSTGLSAALGVAEHVAQLLIPDLLPAARKSHVCKVRVPSLCESDPRPWMDARLIDDDPDYGRMLCHCERVTVGEVRDALRSAIPPRSLGALRRRTRAMFGRCQGFACGARLLEMLQADGERRAHAGDR